jgi:hypothetical protein
MKNIIETGEKNTVEEAGGVQSIISPILKHNKEFELN